MSTYDCSFQRRKSAENCTCIFKTKLGVTISSHKKRIICILPKVKGCENRTLYLFRTSFCSHSHWIRAMPWDASVKSAFINIDKPPINTATTLVLIQNHKKQAHKFKFTNIQSSRRIVKIQICPYRLWNGESGTAMPSKCMVYNQSLRYHRWPCMSWVTETAQMH